MITLTIPKIGSIVKMVYIDQPANINYNGNHAKILRILQTNPFITAEIEIIEGYMKGQITTWKIDGTSWTYQDLTTDWDL